jgi:hypothetical protein
VKGYTYPTGIIACELCGEDLDLRGHVWQRACGWIERRTDGGPNALALPERDPTRMAHDHCIELERKKISARQGALW